MGSKGGRILTLEGILLRFLLGGSAVAATYMVGRKLGGRVGGIFAAFPAVYVSAVISTAAGLTQSEAAARTLAVSRGALIGMVANIGCAVATAWFVSRWGWRRGLAAALSGWLVVATLVFAGGAALGWVQ